MPGRLDSSAVAAARSALDILPLQHLLAIAELASRQGCRAAAVEAGWADSYRDRKAGQRVLVAVAVSVGEWRRSRRLVDRIEVGREVVAAAVKGLVAVAAEAGEAVVLGCMPRETVAGGMDPVVEVHWVVG